MLPSVEDKDDLLLACRFGDVDDVKAFVDKFGPTTLADIRDENGNSILHMACGNGHEGEDLFPCQRATLQQRSLMLERCLADVLDYLLPIVPPSLLATQNSAGSTPLHWATLNAHLPVVKKLVLLQPGPGVDLIDIRNAAGHSPLAEAEFAGWDEGATWLVQKMNLHSEIKEKEVDKEDEDLGGESGADASRDIEVEIQDADGQMAKMTIGGQVAQQGDAATNRTE